MLETWSVDMYLAQKLYRHAPTIEKEDKFEPANNAEILNKAFETFHKRQKMHPSTKPANRTMRYYCTRICPIRKEEFINLKAQNMLSTELDIKYIVRSLRYLKNAVSFLTTTQERQLIRMQLKRNVIWVEKHEFGILAKKDPLSFSLAELQKHYGYSSVNGTEEDERLISSLKAEVL